MLLKCRYLSQFSVSEVAKNASNISKAMEMCPFMAHARRTLATTSSSTSTEAAPATAPQPTSAAPAAVVEPQQVVPSMHQVIPEADMSQMECTNTFNCPFFKKGNLELQKLIKRKTLDTDQSSDSVLSSSSSSSIQQPARKHRMIVEQHKQQQHHHRQQQLPLPEQTKQPFDYEKFFGSRIDAKKQDGSYRTFKRVIRHAKSFPSVQELDVSTGRARDITVWCSNDYLGLGRHEYVQSRVAEAVWQYGAGSGGTRNISGSTPLHDKLEHELARLHDKQAAIVFTSCYVANDTTLYTMAKMLPQCEIVSDAGNHASMIQGIRNSGVPKHIFRHNDCDHLESILRKIPVARPKIVAFESVHSMDGSICDLHRMCDLTHKYGGIAFVDEVHAVGLYGANGAGIGEQDSALAKMDIISGTLGKAFGNVGGYIAGSSRFVDMIRSYGSGFIFTTSLPPSVAAGALAAIEISRSDEGRALRAKHQEYARLVKERLVAAGLPVMASPSHIVPVMVGDVTAANEICNRLLRDHGIYIQAINYPTVARGEERLRIVPNPHHSVEMVEQLIVSLVDVWTKTGLKLMKPQHGTVAKKLN